MPDDAGPPDPGEAPAAPDTADRAPGDSDGEPETTSDPAPSEPLREDPETGSTPTDPSAEETGPYGRDPMAGPAPSG